MTLDILNDLEWEEDELSMAALSFVRQAQSKKDALTAEKEQKKEETRYLFLKNGTLRSSMYQQVLDKLEQAYTREVNALKDQLTFQIKFLGDGATPPEESQTYNYPYNPDYSLDSAGRYYAVYNYYMTMTDAQVRFALFQADTVAPGYLGEFYSTLYDRLQNYAHI